MLANHQIFQTEQDQNIKLAMNQKRSDFRVNTRRKLTDQLLQKSRSKMQKLSYQAPVLQQNNDQVDNQQLLNQLKPIIPKYMKEDPHKLSKHIQDQCKKMARNYLNYLKYLQDEQVKQNNLPEFQQNQNTNQTAFDQNQPNFMQDNNSNQQTNFFVQNQSNNFFDNQNPPQIQQNQYQNIVKSDNTPEMQLNLNLQYVKQILQTGQLQILKEIFQSNVNEIIFKILSEEQDVKLADRIKKGAFEILQIYTTFQASEYAEMAQKNPEFIQIFFKNFCQDQDQELQEIALLGIGCMMMDFPQVKTYFYQAGYHRTLSQKLKGQNSYKFLKKLLWLLVLVTQVPYNPIEVMIFFQDIDYLTDRYKGNFEIIKSITKVLYNLTHECGDRPEDVLNRVQNCGSLCNFRYLVIELIQASDEIIGLQSLEILFNMTQIVDPQISNFLLAEHNLLDIISKVFLKTHTAQKNEAACILLNLCYLNGELCDKIVKYQDNKFISLVVRLSSIESYSVRESLFQCVARILQVCDQNSMCDLLSMGCLECLVDSLDFQDVYLINLSLETIGRCLVFGLFYLGNPQTTEIQNSDMYDVYGNKIDIKQVYNKNQNPIREELNQLKFREVLDTLLQHGSQQIQQMAQKILEQFYD